MEKLFHKSSRNFIAALYQEKDDLPLAYPGQMCYDNTNLYTTAAYVAHQGCCNVMINGRERDASDIWAVRE